MNIKKYLKSAFVIAVSAITLSSCVRKDEWETPPINCNNKFDAPNITLADFKAKAPASGYILITDDQIFDGYVVSSDENGNFYKTISFQDKPENPTAGLQMEVDRASNFADFPVGAHIRINAKGLRLGLDRGVVKIGSVDPTYAIGRIPSSLFTRYISGVCDGNKLEIATMVPKALPSLNAAKNANYINLLVTVPNVKFVDAEIGKTYVDYVAGAGVDTDRSIEDDLGGSTVMRNSGFSTFGSQIIPNKMGDLTFVVSRYNANFQMLIRSLGDVNFTKTLPELLLSEGFANFTTNGWTTYSVAGAQVWGITTFGNPAPSAIMNGFGGVNEDWLITKAINLTGYTEASVSFESDGRYAGNPMELYVTSDVYSGGDPRSLNWVKLTDAVFDPDLAAFAGFYPSGNVSLNSYVNKTIRIAFKYTNATSSAATSWEVDNFKVKGIK